MAAQDRGDPRTGDDEHLLHVRARAAAAEARERDALARIERANDEARHAPSERAAHAHRLEAEQHRRAAELHRRAAKLQHEHAEPDSEQAAD
jgi:hypothetical protein